MAKGGWARNRTAIVGGAMLALAGADAAAQGPGEALFDRGNNESVRDRPRPDYAPIGAPLGAFRLFPAIEIGVGHSDNVFAAEANEQSDSFADLRGRVRVQSEWSRHAVVVTADGERRAFADLEDESTSGWGAGAEGRLDLLRGAYVFAGAGLSDRREPRGVNDALTFAEPVQIEAERAFAGAVREAGRVRLRIEGEIAQADFADAALISGGQVDQDFRDEETRTLRGRIDVAISPDTALFLFARQTERDFDDVGAPTLRDFDQTQALIGASFDLSRLVRGEVGIGYTWADFADPSATSKDGWSASTTLEWFPSELTTVRFDLRRGLEPSGLIGAAALTETVATLRVDHEVRRNILVAAEAAYSEADLAGLDREDEWTRLSLRGDWLLNRIATLSAQLNHISQDSVGANRGRDYDQTSAVLTATVQR
jgi:hypothetical protein